MKRYYVYSIEYGNPPWLPYLETDDKDLAIETCTHLTKSFDVTAYVVDREPVTMFPEIFVSISSDYSRVSYRKYGSLK